MKRRIRAFFLLVATVFLPSCLEQVTHNQQYEPIGLFAPAYQAISAASGQDSSYNLDATMRIIRGVELAMTESEDFGTFLDQLSRQDYRYVAEDVLEAEKKLFPVMQKMYLLEQQNAQFTGIWMILKESEATLMMLVNDFLLSQTTGDVFSLAASVGAAFDHFAEENSIKKKNAKELEELKAEYAAALQECLPVFLKYKEEWEQLCVQKDQAYLDLYDGRTLSSYNIASKVLDAYPDDRDALLIKALSLSSREDFGPGVQLEAEATLDDYIRLYPTRTAPAYLIKGILATREGDTEKAFSFFEHAAIEYPRQAAALTDMLDAYVNRPYFSKTHEGIYFQQMYKSTLEGYGFFSPNFQKALCYEQSGQREKADREIYDHFFRRGSQAVHDYLLSDMEFCDKHLHGAFSRMFPESDKIDLNVEGKHPFLGKRHLDIEIANKTDKSLLNVRVFLCHHLVGMYPGDYVVESLSPVNSIPAGESYNWKSRTYAEKDIVYSRAVLLTDDRICWIDSPEYKLERGQRNDERPLPDTPAQDTILRIPPQD